MSRTTPSRRRDRRCSRSSPSVPWPRRRPAGRSSSMPGWPASRPAASCLHGLTGGGVPWVIDEGRAKLFADGRLEVEVEGLVLRLERDEPDRERPGRRDLHVASAVGELARSCRSRRRATRPSTARSTCRTAASPGRLLRRRPAEQAPSAGSPSRASDAADPTQLPGPGGDAGARLMSGVRRVQEPARSATIGRAVTTASCRTKERPRGPLRAEPPHPRPDGPAADASARPARAR